MDRIEIQVEFRQRTVAGLADCKASKIFSMPWARGEDDDAVQYVQRIMKSNAMDVVITFTYNRNGIETATSRIWYDHPEDSQYHVVKWERANILECSLFLKITAGKIRELFNECIDKYEGKEVV